MIDNNNLDKIISDSLSELQDTPELLKNNVLNKINSKYYTEICSNHISDKNINKFWWVLIMFGILHSTIIILLLLNFIPTTSILLYIMHLLLISYLFIYIISSIAISLPIYKKLIKT